MIKDKIKNPADLKKRLLLLKRCGKRIAFTNGCFDILHYGHAKYLEDAKRLCDILVVALNTDSSVKHLKGKARPIFRLRDRMRTLAALESVDYVTYFGEDTPAKIIKYLKPDMVVKGGDYRIKDIVGNEIVKRYGGATKAVPYYKGYSVTSIIKRIAKISHNRA
jgi:D-beta-D-heptose 7-phosphate kinase/D-beta-D-heptose 1-phosphate adenosyltransferase